jgi:sirohydrochlorin cobaltochelatase
MTPPDRAFFLVAHGSRDARTQESLLQWAKAFQAQLMESGNPSAAWVQTGTLEFADQPLAEQLVTFAHRAKPQGIRTVIVIPLFLLAGVHVLEDIPEAVAIAQSQLGHQSHLQLTPHFGAHPDIPKLLRLNMQHQSVERWILLSHGTRRPEGQRTIEAIAAQLGILSAYWTQPPSLRACLSQINPQESRLGILPYFMCAGSILDAISAQLYELKLEFNKFDFLVAPSLQPNAMASKCLRDLCFPAEYSFSSAQRNPLLSP